MMWAEYPDLLELSFMTQLHDGSVALSPQNNTLDIINLQEDIPQHTEINLEFQAKILMCWTWLSRKLAIPTAGS